jgi:hypothetical protein
MGESGEACVLRELEHGVIRRPGLRSDRVDSMPELLGERGGPGALSLGGLSNSHAGAAWSCSGLVSWWPSWSGFRMSGMAWRVASVISTQTVACRSAGSTGSRG